MESKYPLHPDFSDVKDSGKPVSSVLLFRLANLYSRKTVKKLPVDTGRISETFLKIPTCDGSEIDAIMYSPANAACDERLPCVINYHGGAYVGAWLPHQKNYCLKFVENVGCRVLFVDYRLAIDHPFPTPMEDCYAALKWAFENSGRLGIDPERIAVFGDSAGGTFAAAVCHLARDRGIRMPCFQMLIYPALDNSFTSESMIKYTDTPELNCEGTKLAWKFYLKNGDCGMRGYAAPMFAEDLSRLPPAYIETAEFDSLHDDGVNYAAKLRGAGIAVELNETEGSYHGFDIRSDREYSKRMLAYRCEVLKRVFYGE